MLGLLIHPRARLRAVRNSTKLVCPVVSLRRCVRAKLGGAVLSLQAPIHYPANASISSERVPKKDSLADFSADIISNEKGPLIREWTPCFRSWSFNYPWLTGYAASLSMRLSVIEFPEIPDQATFFNSQAFKYGIGSYLESVFGNTIVNGASVYPVKGPFNWKVWHHTRLASASLEMMHDNKTDKELFFFTHLERNKIICLNFFMRRYGRVSSDQEAEVIFSAMEKLANDIILSVSVEFNVESDSRIKSIEASSGVIELDANFPPIQWGEERKELLTLPT